MNKGINNREVLKTTYIVQRNILKLEIIIFLIIYWIIIWCMINSLQMFLVSVEKIVRHRDSIFKKVVTIMSYF